MKINKLTSYLGIAGLAFAFVACTDDEPKYNPAPAEELLPAYFSMEDEGEIVLDETTTTYQVPVYRAESDAAASVALSYTVEPATDALSVPASVDFAPGETSTMVTVSVNPEKITPNTDYALSLVIGEGINTPYALQKVTYPLIYEAWITLTGTDSNGNVVDKARFTDDLVASLYGLDVVEYEVTMQYHPDNDKIVRVVDPYGSDWPYSVYGDYDSSKHHYMYFNISDPEMVYLCDKNGTPLGYRGSSYLYNTGLTLSSAEGEISLTGYFNYYLNRNNSAYVNYAGKLQQGNITFGEKEMLAALANESGLYYANTSGKFRIILPGYDEYQDPSTTWAEIGQGTFSDGMLYPLLLDEGEEVVIPSYKVPVMQYGGDPNLYRIMNPWKAGICPYGIDYSGDKYIQLDVTNPDCVIMPLQSTGLSFGGQGLYFTNMAYFYINNQNWTEAQIIENGLNETFSNNVITGPAGTLLWGLAGEDGRISLSVGEYEWKLALPNAPAGSKAKVSARGGNLVSKGQPAKRAHAWAEIQVPLFKESNKTLK